MSGPPAPLPLPRRNSMSMAQPPLSQKRNPPATMKRSSSGPPSEVGSPATSATNAKPSSPNSSIVWERTVKKLRLSKALTIPEATTISDACRRMAARRVDAVLLTDANALLSGIVTDKGLGREVHFPHLKRKPEEKNSKDITTRVIAEDLRPEQTVISKVMTRNPIFVNSDSLAIDALQKMVQGKFRHLPVVENGEVIALLDITKCLYDAISRMEKAAEQGSAVAAAVEGVERQFGSNLSASLSFIETLRERVFKPSLSTVISDTSRVAIVVPSDPIQIAAKKMRELRVNSVLIMTGNDIQGILTSRDILFRVVAQNLSPDLTLVEKVMTPNPECATLETTILDALHIMHDRKFLHLPVVDKDGCVTACLDVLQITHAAISMVETSSGSVNDAANIQNFWDSALNLEPPEDYDSQSEMSMSQYVASEVQEHQKPSYTSGGLGNVFSFKFQDLEGHVHRFNFGTENLAELVSAVVQRVGTSNVQTHPRLSYEDEEGDKVLLTADGDLANAVTYARAAGLKVLKLQLDYIHPRHDTRNALSDSTTGGEAGLTYLHYGVFAGGAVLASVGVLVYLKRANK